MLQNIYFESFLILKPLMTTPLSWVGNTLLRYGGSDEHIGFDWGNHKITIGNYREESGSSVPYNEIVLGMITDGAGLEITGLDTASAFISAGSDNASISMAADTKSQFSIIVSKTTGSFSFGFPDGDSVHLPIEANISNSSAYVIFSAAGQKDDKDKPVYLEIANYGIHLPLLWDTSATNSAKVENIDYSFQLYDAEFLSMTDNSNVQIKNSRNNMLAKTIPSTYAVRSALAATVPAPFSFVAKTDTNNNDFFGVKFTDPANPEKLKHYGSISLRLMAKTLESVSGKTLLLVNQRPLNST